MRLEGRVNNAVQMYDENGQPFYPPTHISCIIGGVNDLDIGTTLNIIELTQCIMPDHRGTLKIKSFNSLIYTFIIDISRADNSRFPINKTIILARDIPDMIGKVEFKALGNSKEDIKIWLENNYLKAIVIPRTERYYETYVGTTYNIKGCGTIIR